MTIDIIASGSTGNFNIMCGIIGIDCGVPWKVIQPYAKQLQLVLTTHCHGDHWQLSTAKALALHRPGLRWGCCDWMLPLVRQAVPDRQIDLYQPGQTYNYGAFTIRPESVPHNVPNCGYHIEMNGERAFYATDLSSIEHVQASGYDLLAIEGNHYKGEILAAIQRKQAAGEYAYELEAMRNHLSIEDAIDWIAEMSAPNTVYHLLHRHVDKEESNG